MKQLKSSSNIFLMVYSVFIIGYEAADYLSNTLWLILVPFILSVLGWGIWGLYAKVLKDRLSPINYETGIAIFYFVLTLGALFITEREFRGDIMLLLLMLMAYSISAFHFFVNHHLSKDKENTIMKE